VTASYRDMWPHLVVLRDDGRLASDGLYEMDKSSLGTLMYLFGERTAEWPSRRLAIVSDGGYLPPDSTIERYRAVRDHYMEAQIYPIFIVWETSWWQEFGDELATWISRIAGVDGVPEPLDRDNPLVRAAVDRSVLRKVWAELVARSARALEPGGGARLLAEAIGKKHIGTTTRSAGTKIPFELHTCSHGVGDLLSVELASLLAPPIASATVAMPATHGGVTPSQYAELLRLHRLGHLTVVTSGEQAEAIDMFGCVDGSFLEFVADVLAPSSSSLPGLTDPTEAMFEGIEDRVDIVRLPAPDHVSLAWDAAVHDIATRAMLTHETPDPRVSVNDMVELPTDPLALAEARLRSG